jgi:hypothetical protein
LVSGALHTSLTLAVSALVVSALACDTHHDPEAWPLPSVQLPQLSCRETIEPAGTCARDGDCSAQQRCALDPQDAYVDRATLPLDCRAPVGHGENRALCELGEECASGVCGLAGVCLAPCRGDEDCLQGQICQPLEARIAQGLAPLQACARVAAFPADVELSSSTLARLAPGELNLRTFAAEGEVAAFALVGACGVDLRITHLAEHDSDHVLFDWSAQLSGRIQPNPIVGDGNQLSVLIPNNPRVPLASAYDVTLTSDAATPLTLISAWRNQPGHVLELNVFYVGTELLGHGLAPYDPAFAAVLERLARRYADIGISLGEVREYAITGALGDELDELEVRTETDDEGRVIGQSIEGLDRLLALSAGADQGGLNVFLVRSMGPVLGVSGATPGALGLQGSGLSGVAIALDKVGLERSDRALFHELGHQLGLFHTSESDGSSIEPLRDTAVCGPELDRDGDGVLRAAECADHGADNLMFWEGDGDRLSAEQRSILRQSLVLR